MPTGIDTTMKAATDENQMATNSFDIVCTAIAISRAIQIAF
jgi:hypothetical protein